ncbi:cache domain-containing protein [Paeniglutamicibacter gangotriensis]|jgi:hypothetical protein|uniref:cache domain-containing protein n=1 Tax=Paeniglutamicibacter gangotriensis TaxID=254787 RepID=UPI0037C90318
MSEGADSVAGQLRLLHSIASGIQSRIGAALEDLSVISTAVCSLLTEAEDQGRRPRRSDLSAIRGDLQKVLGASEPTVDGVGVAAAVDYLEDSPYWLEWWRRSRNDDLEFVAHSLNPHRDVFYDYSSRAWFTAPAATGQTIVTGPYVDVGGTNAYTVTLSIPLFTRRGFAGIAGADIAAARFEQFLVGPGRDLRPVVLANAALRVIASNSADYLPGALLQGGVSDSWVQVPVTVGMRKREPWRLFHP